MKFLTEDAKWELDIALQLACKANQPKVVQFLLAEKKCSPNTSKRSLLQLTSSPDIIKLLLQYGANPADVYKFHSEILGTKQPLRHTVKVFVVGNPTVGKSTLTAALQKEPLIEILSIPKKVSRVDEKTAGVIPYEFNSKRFGRITLYDFAGQREFYGSHAALLCNAIQSSPPIFLLVVNINESDENIKKNIKIWLSFIENQCTSVDCMPHLIIIGSHADILQARGEYPEDKKHIVEGAMQEAQLLSMEFVGFVPINCCYSTSPGMRKLRCLLKESSSAVRSQAVSFSDHCFHLYLHDKFRDKVAVRLKAIQEQIKRDSMTRYEQATATFISFVPTDLEELSKFCKELNDLGHILFLSNESKIEDSWVVIDKSSLLAEVTGTVFAPNNFKEHLNLASSTGVVPFSKIEEHFPNHDSEMIIGYFTHLEFCHEICDADVLHLIDKDMKCTEKSERHFFFPGLVTLSIPDKIWKPNPQQFSYHCGWVLQCTKTERFFTNRFNQVLMLRLAFSHALAKLPNEIDDTFPAIQRECSIWTNGIFWANRSGTEVLVNVHFNEAVIVLMRCEDIHLMKCIECRSNIIKTVLQCAEEFCPKVQTHEFFLDPSEVTEYSVIKDSLTELRKYPTKKVANIILTSTDCEKACIVLHKGSISLKHLLQLEPYAVLTKDILKKLLCEPESNSVSDSVINEISECGCENPNFIKMFDPRSHQQNTVVNLYYALKKWKEECGGKFKHLRERFNQYSIFAGRESDILLYVSIRSYYTIFLPLELLQFKIRNYRKWQVYNKMKQLILMRIYLKYQVCIYKV